MSNTVYYIYCKGILGVRTNQVAFRWIYGSVAPRSSREEYEKCAVKLELSIIPEKKLSSSFECEKRFQSYMWESKKKVIHCRRTFLRHINVGFDIRIDGNTVYADIGLNYYRFIKNRFMNLHGMYYLLADLLNIILLKNGFLSLYASAVYSEVNNRGLVCFAPPNTGKTVTARNLCEFSKCKMVGEDIVITDTKNIYACPWTLSYRRQSTGSDNAGSLGRSKRTADVLLCESCILTDIAVLSLGKHNISEDKHEILQQICMLNGYVFGYYSTPIVKLLAYFDEDYRKPWTDCATVMLNNMVERCQCCLIQEENAMNFAERVSFEK